MRGAKMTRESEAEVEVLRARLCALEAIVAHSLDAILLTRPDGRILSANPAACRLFDRTEEELRTLGREAVVDTTAPGYAEGLEARRRCGRYQGPIRLVRRDGSRIDAEISTAVFREPDGTEKTSMVIRDVSERRRVARALAESERRFRILTTMSPFGVMQTDAEANCLYLNERWCQIAALPPDAAQGRGWLAAVHPDDRDALLGDWSGGGETEGGGGREYRLQRPDGQVTWVLGHVRVIPEASGGVAGYVATMADVTERRRTQELLVETEKLRAVQQLANAAAHEINNPLVVVVGQLHLLELGLGEDETARGRIDVVRAAIERIRRIVSRMASITSVRRLDDPRPDLPEMLDL